MSRQQIFYAKRYQRIEKAIVKLLNDQPDFLSAPTASSPRAIGDAIQAILSDSFQTLLGDLCHEYTVFMKALSALKVNRAKQHVLIHAADS